MNPALARLLSVFFHPLLLPTYLFLLVLYYLPESLITFPAESRWVLLTMVFFTTFTIPALGTYAMRRTGYLSSMEMENREQRRMPLFFTGICYAITTVLFYREQGIDQLFYVIMALITLSVFLTFLVTIFWQISAHAVGLGGSLGILLLLNTVLPGGELLYPVLALLLLSGLVMSARLALHAHTVHEVYAGFLMGLSIGLGMWLTLR